MRKVSIIAPLYILIEIMLFKWADLKHETTKKETFTIIQDLFF